MSFHIECMYIYIYIYIQSSIYNETLAAGFSKRINVYIANLFQQYDSCFHTYPFASR